MGNGSSCKFEGLRRGWPLLGELREGREGVTKSEAGGGDNEWEVVGALEVSFCLGAGLLISLVYGKGSVYTDSPAAARESCFCRSSWSRSSDFSEGWW